MKTMHLFAGAGGGLLCDLILGHEPIVAVEWDTYCCRVLRERAADGWFPSLHVWEGDVRLFDPSEYAGRVEVVHAGFPCTDISRAGNQAGVGEGTRSGLYREVLRIADIVRPRYLFMENVAAILANEFLGTVLGDLAARGYDARWTCVPASAAGAPHYRDRWWCLAERTDANGERELQPEGREPEQRGWAGDVAEDVANAGCRRRYSQKERQMEQSRGAETLGAGINVADAPNKGVHKRRRFGRACKDVRLLRRNGGNGVSCCGQEKAQLLADADRHACGSWREDYAKQSAIRGNADRGCQSADVADSMLLGQQGEQPGSLDAKEWAQSGERQAGSCGNGIGWWTVEPGIRRVVDGIPDRAHRIKALGNAQVPLQAALAWMMLGGAIDSF